MTDAVRRARPVATFAHGTLTGYNRHACRCADCTAAKRDYQRATRDTRLARDRASYAADPHRRNASAKTYHARRVAIVARYKLAKGCADCGHRGPAGELHLHHRDPRLKSFNIAMSLHRQWSLVKAEIAKCDVLCQACHRDRHRATTRTRP